MTTPISNTETRNESSDISPASPTAPTASTPGQPTNRLEVEEPNESDIDYPSGPQLYLNVASILLVSFLNGLDLTIVAVAIPSLTNEFKTLEDIGWYSAVYGLILSSTSFLFGKLYTLFGLKKLYVTSIVIFELGSILCTFAPSSKAFILGRTLSGLGAAGQASGTLAFIARSFPSHQRPMVNGLWGFSHALGLVSAPVIGGALIDAFSWRACFGINVPIGVVAVIIACLFMRDPFPNANLSLPFKEKARRIDPIGTVLVVPSLVCLMTGLQWGGIKYGWSNWRIILLLVVFAVLMGGFGWVQHRQQEKAMIPLRILKNRTVLGATLFLLCVNGLLATTEAYISIYFQGVQGYSATKSGLLGLPMIAGLAVAGLIAAFGTTWVGYYTPFIFATSILAPIASGLLTTIDLDDVPGKVAALLGFIGVAVGIGMQGPTTATMTIISPREVSIALGVLMFGGGIGSSLSVVVSAALFQNRLTAEVSKYAPGTNTTSLTHIGLAEIRQVIGPARLKEVLSGYNEAVVQTLYIPLGLGLLTIVAALSIQIKSVKKKPE